MSGKRWALLGAVVVLLVGGLVAIRVLTDEPDLECDLDMSLGHSAGGDTYPLEDQGAPGRDSCDETQWPEDPVFGGPDYIGFDCKLHGPEATPETVMAPNRSDGTCGQRDDERPG